MKLRLQLGLASCSLLAIPWALHGFLSANEAALQALQQERLEQRALGLAGQLSNKLDVLYPNPRRLQQLDAHDDLMAKTLLTAPIVDGYFGDWNGPSWQNLADERRPFRVALGIFNDRLYMAMTIADRTKRYRRAPVGSLGNGDQLRIRARPSATPVDYVIAPAAPGFFSVPGTSVRRNVNRSSSAPPINRDASEQDLTLQGSWVELAEGYQLEISIPLTAVGHQLGLIYTDVDEGGISHRGNTAPEQGVELPWLVYPSAALQSWFSKQTQGTAGVHIYDRWGHLLIGRSATSQIDADTGDTAIAHWIYRYLLPGASLTQRSTSTIQASGVVVGTVAVEDTRQNYLSFNAAAVQTLLFRGGLAVVLSLIVLFGFAGLISWRIVGLSRRMTRPPSSQTQTLARFHWHDEIDALAQQFQKLLAQRDQTEQYLRALPRTLAHEIRTPIAIISNSFEHLGAHDLSAEETQRVLARTKDALQRLSNMLGAMNEANRLEATIDADERRSMDLVPLLEQLADAYGQTFSPWTIRLAVAPDSAVATVAADALVQAMDKLVSNAASFATPNTVIELRLVRRALWWRLSVVNVGPALPGSTDALFAPMVSMRDKAAPNNPDKTSGHHMGLGLYIVRLVAQQHGGEPWARNLPDLDAVEVGFTVRA